MRPHVVLPAALVIGVLTALAAMTLLAPPRLRLLALPLLALTGAVAGLVAVLANRDGSVPIEDIGLWVCGFAWLYGALPVITYILVGYEFTPVTATRVVHSPAMTATVARVCWYYALFTATFATAYALVRGRVRPLAAAIALPSRSRVVAILAVAAGSALGLQLIGFVFQLQAQDYVDAYRVVQQLPLAVRQFYNISNGIRIIMILGVLVLLFAEWRRWWPLIALWLAYALVSAFVVLGSRTALMVLLASSTVLFHRFVRRIGLRAGLLFGAGALVMFTALGLLRALRSLQAGGSLAGMSPGEFEIVFMNALDLMVRIDTGTLGTVPFGVRVIDFVGFIPSQLLPFEKVDPAGWLTRFYPALAASGGGLAFGTIAQAVIGLGALEVVLRAALLAGVSAVVFRLYRRHAENYWATVAYLWLLVLAYQPIRANTLIMFNVAVQQVLPAVLLVLALAWVLRQALAPPGLAMGTAAPRS